MITSSRGTGILKNEKKGVEVSCRGGSSQGLYFLHLEITLLLTKLCYASEEKNFFFCHPTFLKKGHSKLSRNEPENIL